VVVPLQQWEVTQLAGDGSLERVERIFDAREMEEEIQRIRNIVDALQSERNNAGA
jgi:hypothetical protein